MILRIKSENGTLKCEYSEMVKPLTSRFIDESPHYKLGKKLYEKFESSFQPIKLITEEAIEYFNTVYCLQIVSPPNNSIELSGKETQRFEVKQKVKSGTMQQHQIGEAGYTYFELHLKSVPVAENVVTGGRMKSAEDILKQLSSGDMSGFNFIEGDLIPYEIVLEAMETYASQYKNQHNHQLK